MTHLSRTRTPRTAATLDFELPSVGPEPVPMDTAVAAVLGYARGRRPLYFRSPTSSDGRWVQLPAFGWERFDRQPRVVGALGEADILVAEGLHGRLDEPAWTAMKNALVDIGPLADAVVGRAGGRALWELPADDFSVLAEPGTVGAALRDIWQHCSETTGVQHKYVAAALHHRHPELFPLLVRTTRLLLLPHLREGDSGVEAAIHRELRDNADAFAALEATSADLGIPLTRVRLHDVLLWLTGTLRLTHAVELGHPTLQWRSDQVGIDGRAR